MQIRHYDAMLLPLISVCDLYSLKLSAHFSHNICSISFLLKVLEIIRFFPVKEKDQLMAPDSSEKVEGASQTSLALLENLATTLRQARAIDVTQDMLKQWTTTLESAVRTAKDEQKKLRQSQQQQVVSNNCSTKERPFTFPTVIDRNKKEPRQLVHAVTQASYQKIRNCGIAIVSVLESVLNQVKCDIVSLSVPYRGHEFEFRCLCALSRKKHEILTGCGIIRGKESIEYAAYSTGYVVTTCPKAMLLMEDTQSEECVSLMELMADPARRVSKTSSVARLCCPVKPSASTNPIATLTISLEGTATFSKETENFMFDAATIIGTILTRCNDYTTLQACFAKGDLRDELQPLPSKVVDIPDPRVQLVYRISHNQTEPSTTVRVVNNQTGKAEKLRDGTPLQTVYEHMEKLQLSWFAAVRLNVELKRKCDEQDRCLAVLLARSRAAVARGPPSVEAPQTDSVIEVNSESHQGAVEDEQRNSKRSSIPRSSVDNASVKSCREEMAR